MNDNYRTKITKYLCMQCYYFYYFISSTNERNIIYQSLSVGRPLKPKITIYDNSRLSLSTNCNLL